MACVIQEVRADYHHGPFWPWNLCAFTQRQMCVYFSQAYPGGTQACPGCKQPLCIHVLLNAYLTYAHSECVQKCTPTGD